MKIKNLFAWLFSIVFIIVVTRSIRKSPVKQVAPVKDAPIKARPSIPKTKASPVKIKSNRVNRKKRKKTTTTTRSQKEDMQKMRARGKSVKYIAKKFNVSLGVVYNCTQKPAKKINPTHVKYYKPTLQIGKHKLTERLYSLLLKQKAGGGHGISDAIQSEIIAMYINSSATTSQISELTGISLTTIGKLTQNHRFNVRKIKSNGSTIYLQEDFAAILRLYTGGAKMRAISETLDIPIKVIDNAIYRYRKQHGL